MASAVSVVMPVYDGSLFLEAQIASILEQSFADLTLLVIDDGSSDNSLSIMAAAAKADRRVQVLPSTGNAGQKRRLYELVRRAESPLLAFSDQDDVWDRDKLARLVAGLGNAGLAFGRSQLIDGAGRDLGTTLLEAIGHLAPAGDRLTLLFQPIASAHAMLARREIVSVAALCNVLAFDWLISVEAAFSSGLAYVEEATTLHRMHGTNQMNGGAHERPRKNPTYGMLLPRRVLRSGQFDRLEFLRMVEFLGCSVVIPPTTQKAFHAAWRLCNERWFVNQPPLRQTRDDALADAILNLLAPFAGSPRDLGFLTDALARLTLNWAGRRAA